MHGSCVVIELFKVLTMAGVITASAYALRGWLDRRRWNQRPAIPPWGRHDAEK